jgi:hypothetical protein
MNWVHTLAKSNIVITSNPGLKNLKFHKRILTKEDYYQLQRYLQESRAKLGLLVNFRNKYIKPKRVVRIDTKNNQVIS